MKRIHLLLGLLVVKVVSINAQTEITTAEQFRNLNLTGDYKLMADIDLTKGRYVPIGGEFGYFNGTFDGNGHTIRITNISDDYQYRGLFSQVGSKGVIKNLKVTGQIHNSMSLGSWIGGIAGRNEGTIINCFSTVHVNCSGALNDQPRSQTAGGIAGINSGTISYCIAAGSIMGAYYSGGIGGVVGQNYSNDSGIINNCIYAGDDLSIPSYSSSSYYYGMICGDVHDDIWADNVSNCFYKINDTFTGFGSSGRKVNDGFRCTPLTQEGFWALVEEGGIYASTEHDVFLNSILFAIAPERYMNLDTKETAGFATFYNRDCNYKADDYVTLYTGVIKGSFLYLLEMDGHIIPKDVPVILKSEKRYFSLNKSYDEVLYTCNNDLKGTNTDITCQPYTKYVLSSEDGNIGFCLFNGNTIKANTAYIPWQEEIDDYEFLSISTIEPSPAITFADNIVKAICVANWDFNGDGELNEGEAAAVNDLGQVFKGNPEIISFNELRFFTGLNSIGDYQFNGCSNLKEIVLPPNISSIGEGAFGRTGFERIDIPEGISSIGKEAFARCNNLIRVSLPSTMQTIGNYAFAWSDNRLSVIFSSPTPPTFKIGSFYSTYVKSVAYVPVGSKVEYEATINYNNYFNKIIEINTELLPLLPQTLTSNIPSMKTYGDATFTLPNITDEGVAVTWTMANTHVVSISNNNLTIKNAGTIVITAKNDGSNDYLPFNQEFTLTVGKAPLTITANDKTKIKGEENPELTISYEGFKYNDDASVLTTNPTITTTVTTDSPVGIYPITVSGATSNNYEITHVNGTLSVISPIINFYDANVKAICIANWDTNGDGELSEEEAAVVNSLDGVFGNTPITTFDELKYFAGLQIIESNDFDGCGNLTSIAIPSSITMIRFMAFESCKSLTTVHITDLGAWCNIFFENNPLWYAKYLFLNGTEITDLIIPDGVTGISGWAFSFWSNLTSVTIPRSVTSVGENAFDGCDGLTTVSIDNSVLKIEKEAFQSCDNLKTFQITNVASWCESQIAPYGNPLWNTHSLYVNDKEVKELVIPEGVTSINLGVFDGYSALASVTVPSSVKTIGMGAFNGCTNLLDIYCLAEIVPATEDNPCFMTQKATLHVPNVSLDAYKTADYWKDFKFIVGLDDVVTESDHIYSDGLSIYQGYTANLEVKLVNENTFTAYQFDLVLPEGITLATDDNGKYMVAKSDRYSDNTQQVKVEKHDNNTYRIMSYSMQNGIIYGNDGVILTITLKADEEITVGNANAEIRDIVLTLPDETKIKTKPIAFSIGVKRRLKGDADGDGEIDVTDIVAMINYIMGQPSEKFVMSAADINDDGEVDIFDVMMAINLVMSQKISARSMARASKDTEEHAYVKATNDGVVLGIDNPARFTAFQFDVEVSDGMELTNARLNDNAGNHKLYYFKNGQNTYRVIGVSMNNSTFIANGNNLVDLSFSMGGHVQISDNIFITPQETKVCFASGDATVTGIESIEFEQTEEIFDLSGRKVDIERDQLPKGIYIINNKKVVIK